MTSADVDALLQLLEQLRGASRLGRAKVLAQAARRLRALPPTERKRFAVEVARQVAPAVVPTLEASDGRLDRAQVGQFVQMVQQLDNDQLAAIATAVRSGDHADPAVRAVLAEVAEVALETLAPPTGNPIGEAIAPEPSDEDAASADVPGAPDLAELELVEDEPKHQELEEHEPVRVEPTDPPTAALDWDFDVAPVIANRPPADEPADGTAAMAARAAARSADLEIAAEERDREQQAASTPDGFRRRRLLAQWARLDLIADEEAVALVGTLARSSDRAWIAGMLLDRGLVLFDQVEHLVDDRAAQRLLARTA